MPSLASQSFAKPIVIGMVALAAIGLQPEPIKASEGGSSVQAQTVQYVDAQSETLNDARILAAAASARKVAIVVWGGNRTIQQEAYNAARDLANIGIPTAFVLGPDHNSAEGDAIMQVYALGAPRSDSHWGTNFAGEVRADMRNAGLAAFKQYFPEQLASLSSQ